MNNFRVYNLYLQSRKRKTKKQNYEEDDYEPDYHFKDDDSPVTIVNPVVKSGLILTGSGSNLSNNPSPIISTANWQQNSRTEIIFQKHQNVICIRKGAKI